jgi:transcription initiation factor TFIID TATA-box-binding protein
MIIIELFSRGFFIIPTQSYSAKYKIENIVIATSFNCEIDLKLVSDTFQDAEYHPNQFPGLFFRVIKPKCTILLFHNGKMIITGLKKASDADSIISKTITKLKVIGLEISEIPSSEIVNLVVKLDIHTSIDLNAALLELEHLVYEPEVFPGAIFRLYNPFKCAFLIFSTGKIILTGINKESQIIPAIKALGQELRDKNLL